MSLLKALSSFFGNNSNDAKVNLRSCRSCWFSQYQGGICQATDPPTNIRNPVFNAVNCDRYTVEAPETVTGARLDVLGAKTDIVAGSLENTNTKLDGVKGAVDLTKVAIDGTKAAVEALPTEISSIEQAYLFRGGDNTSVNTYSQSEVLVKTIVLSGLTAATVLNAITYSRWSPQTNNQSEAKLKVTVNLGLGAGETLLFEDFFGNIKAETFTTYSFSPIYAPTVTLKIYLSNLMSMVTYTRVFECYGSNIQQVRY